MKHYTEEGRCAYCGNPSPHNNTYTKVDMPYVKVEYQCDECKQWSTDIYETKFTIKEKR